MAEHGFKTGILPDHCGKCVFLEWEEYTCICRHPAWVDTNELMEYLRDELGPKATDEEIVTCAHTLHGMRMEDADWHGYDCVCDLFNDRKVVNGKSQAMEDARKAYEARAIELWRKYEENQCQHT